MNRNKKFTTINRTALKRTKNDIKFIVVHYVGALGDAKDNASYYSSTYVGASADFYVGFKGDVWQGNDYYSGYSWHCGGGYQSSWTTDGAGKYYGVCTNKNSVGIEMCVRKHSTKSMNATDTDWYFEKATVNATIELVAELMKELDIDEDHVVRHFSVNRKLCPNPFVVDGGKAWKQFKADLHQYVTGNEIKVSDTPFSYYYRVRTTWKNADSQLGAYTVKENAIENCPIGYSVFDEAGKAIYTNRDVKTGTQSSDFTADMTEAQCASVILEMARVEGLRCGILPSLIACQAILESGYCRTTELVRKSNNCFGMKTTLSNNDWYSVWDGKSKVNIRTPEEYVKGQITYIYADFRAYPCIEKSFEDHSCYLLGAKNGNKLRYSGLTTAKNLKEAATIVKNGGYATDSLYVSKLVSICERYGLDRYDSEVASKVVVNKPVEVETLKIYRVGTGWKNGHCVGQIGAFTVFENAIDACDVGYNVYDWDGKVVYTAVKNEVDIKVVEKLHPLIEFAREFNAAMKEDIANGKPWYYSNHDGKNSFKRAREMNRLSNCALFIYWLLHALGVLKSGQRFYGSYGKIVWMGEGTEEALREACDIIDVKGKTAKELIKDGTLQPGDICCYLDMQHTNMYGKNGKWWDAGHAYAKGTGEMALFTTWMGDGVHINQRIKYIIRLKRIYYTTVGEYDKKSEAKALVEKLIAEGLTKANWKKMGDKYVVYTGAFKTLANAKKRAEKTIAVGHKSWVVKY